MFRQAEFPITVPVCAWCARGERGHGLGAISHGICPRHLRRLAHKIKGISNQRRVRRRHSSEGEALLPF